MFSALRFFTRIKIVRYLMAGGSAAVLHIGTVYVLTEVYTVWYLFATTAGFLLAVTYNFLLQKYWTFAERSTTGVGVQTVSFFLVNGFNLLLNGLLMFYFVEKVALIPVVAQFAASALIAIESFIAYSFIFKKKPAAEATTL